MRMGPAQAKVALAAELGQAVDGTVVAAAVADRHGLPLRAVIVAARALRADGWAAVHGYGPDAVVELTERGRAAAKEASAGATA